jgi:hypothetical protein
MQFAVALAQQPLFRLLAAFIVLLVADYNPIYGIAALGVWIAWIYVGRSKYFSGRQ